MDNLSEIDFIDGLEFERFCADTLMYCGYENVTVTQGSGDQGVDIIAERDLVKYAIQCKRYQNNIGNSAVQEVFSGKSYYDCDVAVVMTNQYFTSSAVELSKKLGVILWDREYVEKLYLKAQDNGYSNTYFKIQAPSPSNMSFQEVESNKYDEFDDDVFDRALEIAVESGAASASLFQRKLRVGYARAARIMDQLDERGFIGPVESGGKPRKALITKAQYLEMKHPYSEPLYTDINDTCFDKIFDPKEKLKSEIFEKQNKSTEIKVSYVKQTESIEVKEHYVSRLKRKQSENTEKAKKRKAMTNH